MFTKYKINLEGFENYRFDKDGNLWKMPFENNNRSYNWRMIKMQYPNRWKIGDDYYSQNQLRPHLELEENPTEIYKVKDTPF